MECNDCVQARLIEGLAERVKRVEDKQDIIENDITTLKVDQGKMFTEMANLMRKIDEFITTIKWCVGGIFGIATIAVSIIAIVVK